MSVEAADMKSVIAKAVLVLKQGGVIIYPTDTVWGIGCDATNEQAVKRIFRLKQRPEAKSMILLIEKATSILPYVDGITPQHQTLLEQTTVPQTVILPCAHGLAPSVMPPEQTIAVRCSNHLFCKRLLQAFGRPLVSTSVNVSGEKPAALFNDINPMLIAGVDYVVPAVFENGSTGKPSRLVALDSVGKLVVLRG